MGNSTIYKTLSSLDKIKWRITLKGVICGLIAGLLVTIYRLGIEFGTESAIKIYAYLKGHPTFILLWLVLLGIVGFIIYWIIRLEPMASGSGIPQVEGIVLYGMKMKWYTILLGRYLGGFLSSFFGVSLGREGPSIQIGASGSQALAKKIGKNKLEQNYLITGGAAAGLAAAFNAPLSGIVFALEEVHRSFSPLILISATTASLTADVVSKYFFGLQPVLSFMAIPQIPISLYLWLLPVGIISGLVGSVINKALLGFQTIYNKLPLIVRPFVAFIIALPCGLFVPEVLGGGQNLIKMAEKANTAVTMLLIFAVIKLLFTCTSFGSGIPGGIFMPILSIGALSGSFMGVIATHFGLPAAYIPDFAVCAMAGALSGSVKAPVTSILLTAEMNGSLIHLLPVASCSFIALLVSDLCKIEPIYEALLDRIMSKGTSADEIKYNKREAILEIPVELGSIASGRMISEVEWPEGSLIVGIHRGNKEIVPNGNIKLLPGDYLVILSSELGYKEINTMVGELCHSK